ncbi:MAG: OsmC family protein [Cyclobacteriaceae bacterium]|nr:MAG: OsmC family protein [Cyclobacteriaceae bacterium]
MHDEGVQVAVATIGNDLYKTELVARDHTVIADEPLDVGGKDLGPRPGDFIRMGLASCTAITLRMYTNRKGWDVQQIRVQVSNGPFDGKTSYKTEIEITGNVNEEQRMRLLQIAKLCPVHKVLTNPIEIDTSLSIT